MCEPYTPINLNAMANDFSNYNLVEPTTIIMMMLTAKCAKRSKVQKGENNWQLKSIFLR